MINIKDVVSTGKFVSVEFSTLSGRITTAWGRTGVYKHAKGGKRTITNKDILCLWCFYRKRYVNIGKSRIISVNGEGVTLEHTLNVAKVEHRNNTTKARMYARTADVVVGRR